ncbi:MULTISPECIES: hypothetical protein [unclassified Pasteurella]|uniref:hypothetical protein n=1 Tax=unclassified Pasteurella TaxID=2621516 RepID=UPI00107434B0|nr:hypothetical protein [Pasteurella sp. 19428wF3_WM03]TFU53004.1 hypothetical protein E4T92_00970 [Pasteurella sp. WM03]
MRKLGKLMLLVFGVVASSVALADWEYATNIGESDTGDVFYTRCYYETLGGFKVSIVVKGFCPMSIEVDPERNKWRRS